MQHNEYFEIKALDKAVDSFSFNMKKRLRDKVKEGYRGWDDPESIPVMMERLEKHLERLYSGNADSAIDVANLAMMLGRLTKSDGEME